MKVGAQLYTVRHSCKNLDDFAETLARIADIGYTSVQVSGTCAYEPAWLQEQLRKNGLQCVITHTPVDDFANNVDNIIAAHNILNCRYIGLGSAGKNGFKECQPERYGEFVTAFRPIAQAIAERGKYFMYHNHAHEFGKSDDGRIFMERLIEDFAPEEMGFTLDTFWVQAGGGDPADWLTKLSGRVPCIHLKDFAYDKKMAVVGEGNLNFDRIFAAADTAGTKYMLVEQDDCNGEDPFDCLRRSYRFLAAHGFE